MLISIYCLAFYFVIADAIVQEDNYYDSHRKK